MHSHNIILFFQSLTPGWFEAVGTILTAILAFYFGIFGNRQIKILMAEKANQLDRESFLFLTQLPSVITGQPDSKTSFGTGEQTIREFISEFENLILNESIYLAQNKLTFLFPKASH